MSRPAKKIAFFHDSRFKRDSGDIFYTAGSLTSELLTSRYVKDFGNLIVVARVEDIDDADRSKYVMSSGDNIAFSCVRGLNLKSLLFGEDRETVRRTVAASDFTIIRMPSILGIFAYIEARRQKKPFMVEMVACPFDSLWNYGGIKHKVAAILLSVVNKYVAWNSPNVLYVTQDFLQGRYPTKGRSIGCSDVSIEAMDDSVFSQRQKATLLKDSSSMYTIGTIANVDVVYKGHEYIIRALSDLKKQGFKVKYQMVGGGKGDRLKALVRDLKLEDSVEFMGVFDKVQVMEWLDSIDIYAQLSLQEGLPRAMIEAMSRGCVTIGAKTGGIPELLSENNIVPKRDHLVFADIAARYMKDSELMGVESENCRTTSNLYIDSRLSSLRRDFMIRAMADV